MQTEHFGNSCVRTTNALSDASCSDLKGVKDLVAVEFFCLCFSP